jgi:cbb3-type cytochrome oxidase subunit 3
MRGLIAFLVVAALIVFLIIATVAALRDRRRDRDYSIEFREVDDRYDGVFLVRGDAASLVYRYPRGDEIEQEIGVRTAQARRKELTER